MSSTNQFCNLKDFWLEDKGDIAIEDSNCIGVTLTEDSASIGQGETEGGGVMRC